MESTQRPLSPPTSPSSSATSEPTYTIIVRGDEFHLSDSQISFDSPNYFTSCFSSGFTEAKDRVLRLDRNPALFALIVEYLSGYPILPLPADSLPPGMGMAMANRCLLADAQYYDLKKLCCLLTQPALPTPRTDLTWSGLANEVVRLCEVLASNIPEGIIRKEDGSIVSARSGLPVLVVTDSVLLRINLANAQTQKISFDIIAPSTGSDLPTHPDEQSSGSISSQSASAVIHAVDFERDALFVMDGMPYPFTQISNSFSGGLHHYSWYQGIYPAIATLLSHFGVPDNIQRQQPTTYTFWADTIYCIFLPGDAAPRVSMVRAKVQSRQSLLDSDMDNSRFVEGGGPSRPMANAVKTTAGNMLDLLVMHHGKLPVLTGP